MGEAYATNGRQRRIKDFDAEASWKETTLKT